MESTIFDDGKEEDSSEEELLDEGTEEEAFMQGYSDEEKVATCDECGTAIRGKSLTKVIDGDTHHFCSEDCAQDFEESLG